MPKKRIFSSENFENFRQCLKNCDWASLYSVKEVDLVTDMFSNMFQNAYEECFPLSESRNNRKHQKLEPWFTKGLLVSRARQFHLYRIWKSSGKEFHKRKFTQYRNLFNKIKFNAKKNYFAHELTKTGRSSKKHWNLLSSACGLKSKKSKTTMITCHEYEILLAME